jgi:hypothetical protein
MARYVASAALACAMGTLTVSRADAEGVDPHTARNPIASVISVPFQDNVNFDVGPYEKTQNVLLIQPVVPFTLSENWTVISPWIVPVIHEPQLSARILSIVLASFYSTAF